MAQVYVRHRIPWDEQHRSYYIIADVNDALTRVSVSNVANNLVDPPLRAGGGH